MQKARLAGIGLALAAAVLVSGCSCSPCGWFHRRYCRTGCEVPPMMISPCPSSSCAPGVSPIPMTPPAVQEGAPNYSPPPYPDAQDSGMR
jgi:hypothetical protein